MERENPIVFLAILGKNNEPKLLKNYSNCSDLETELKIMCFSCLDFFVEKTSISRVPSSSSDKIESYLGKIFCMFTIEGQLSFYGFLTNTNHKYILVKLEDKIESSTDSNSYIKEFFKKIQKIYVNFSNNPFMVEDSTNLTDVEKGNKEYFEQQLEKKINDTVSYYQQFLLGNADN
mmetsp:Transcript_25486/g.28310  ORF Transcript_25486/g.28310 Transcript_25486/m.28310 type:complete len:176 (-) Transcript_25486:54-581(-)